MCAMGDASSSEAMGMNEVEQGMCRDPAASVRTAARGAGVQRGASALPLFASCEIVRRRGIVLPTMGVAVFDRVGPTKRLTIADRDTRGAPDGVGFALGLLVERFCVVGCRAKALSGRR